MDLNLLINCTIDVLKLLIEQYHEHKINYNDFCSNVDLKVKFLEENIQNIGCFELRKKALDILVLCNKIKVRS